MKCPMCNLEIEADFDELGFGVCSQCGFEVEEQDLVKLRFIEESRTALQIEELRKHSPTVD